MNPEPARERTGARGVSREQQKADRRSRLRTEAARLFAERGFHGVSIEDLGASVGMSGPALYRHYPSKEALLADVLVSISQRLLDGGRQQAEQAADPHDALRRLVCAHAAFAISEPELIRVQDRDLASLSSEQERRVRRLQRAYVEIWVAVLAELQPELPEPVARTKVQAVFGLLNSTPHSAFGRDAATTRTVLEQMAMQSLR